MAVVDEETLLATICILTLHFLGEEAGEAPAGIAHSNLVSCILIQEKLSFEEGFES